MPKRRRREQARAEETRRRLIQVAIETFAAVGYDGTSTRELAKRAGANLSAIRYYFGDKEGLYRAAIQHIAESFRERISPFLESIRSQINDPGIQRKELIESLCNLVSSLASQLLGPNMDDSWTRLVFREEMNPTAGHALLFKTERLVIETTAEIIAKIFAQRPESEKVIVRTMSLLGQVFVFQTSRAAVLRATGWKELGKREISILQSVLEDHCRALMAK
jgi:TetR/AcrR family transcriptional regulator, regulator of cefoperazone and chloramphenicol sensitivity